MSNFDYASNQSGGFNNRILYNDINFEGISLATGNSAPDLINLFGQGNIIGRGFDGNNTLEQLFGGGEVLHDYKEGEDIQFHIHWMPTTNNAGNVKWFIEYAWYNAESDQEQPIVNTLSVVDSSGGIAWFPNVIGLPLVNGEGKKIGSHIRFRLYRNPADPEDTYPNDAALDSFGIHYPVDSDGSKQLFIK